MVMADICQVRRFQIRLAQKEQFYEAVRFCPEPTCQLRMQVTVSVSNQQTIRPALRAPPSRLAPAQPNQFGQASGPKVSTFASQTTATNAMPVPQPQMQQNAVIGSNGYRSNAFDSYDQHNRTQAAHTTNSRAIELTSSAPVPAGMRGSGHLNLYVPRPSTAPIVVPRSLDADLPPQRELPFATRNEHTVADEPQPFHRAVMNDTPTKLNRYDNDEKQAQAQTPAQSTSHRPAAAQTTEHMNGVVVEASKTLAIGKLRAEDIDTQKLLDRVAARRSNSTKKEPDSKPAAKVLPAPQSQTRKSSQKRRRPLRCTHCRSKRIKCGFNDDNPDGACQPCIEAERPCSFVAETEDRVDSRATNQAKPEIQVQNSQDNGVEGSPSRQLSLRSRDIQLAGAPVSLVSQKIPLEEVIQSKLVKTEVPRKRPSQVAMPAPKRLKAPDVKPRDELQTTSRAINAKGQSQRKLELPTTKAQRAVRELSNPPIHIRSDATTATAETLDLDPIQKPQKPTRESSPTRPLYSELSAITDQAGPAYRENRPPQPAQNSEPTVNAATKSAAPIGQSLFDQSLAELMDLSPNERNACLDRTFVGLLQDDNFIPYCQMLGSRWEQHLFNPKI
ncbi:hypothetical protein OHC33_002353 [Knufia fluminis]|uniref:Zn(2)-C6 fungal-type domain-containing protein n=1 Tax=Knufia fluminis TaxID=191047 RepID=A0AAN8EIT9_9EURO|nr:hypothetical protein OHC33_002353 [Knufia fluminis]